MTLTKISITNLGLYAECHILFIVMLNVFILNVIMLVVVAPCGLERGSLKYGASRIRVTTKFDPLLIP